MKKQFASLLMCVTMVLTMLPVTVWAEESAAATGTDIAEEINAEELGDSTKGEKGESILNGNSERDVEARVVRGTADIVASGECGAQGDNVTWTLNSQGKLTVSGNGEIRAYDPPHGDCLVGNEATGVDIQSVAFYEGVTRIGARSFCQENKLLSVSMANSVSQIGYEAFWGCTNLTSVIIPAGMTQLERGAFYDCTGLTAIVFLGHAPQIGLYAFGNITATVYYPADDSSWNGVAGQHYGGNLTWKTGTPESIVPHVKKDNHLKLEPVGDVYKTVTPGGSVTLQVKASADETDGLMYHWFIGIPDYGYEVIEGILDSYVVTNVRKRALYACVVTDKYGNSARCEFTVNVDQDNELRMEAVDGKDIFEVRQYETVYLAAKATALDTREMKYQWYWIDNEGNEHIIEDAASSNQYTVSYAEKTTQYFCEATDRYGNTARCYFVVYVNNSDGFKAVPVEGSLKSVLPGKTVELKVRVLPADMSNLKYQWYWIDEEHKSHLIEGADRDTYIAGPEKNMVYECSVTGSGKSDSTFFSVNIENHLSVDAAGEWLIQLPVGGSATLSVTVTGDDLRGITYQWYKGSEMISGANGASYTVTNVREPAIYDCYVKDRFGNSCHIGLVRTADGHGYMVHSFNIHLENNLHVEPVGNTYRNVPLGQPVTLQVRVTANDLTGLTYRWSQRSYEGYASFPIEGVSTDSYTVENVQYRQYYDCEVSDLYGNAKSVSFSVGPENHFQITPANDGLTTRCIKPGESTTLQVRVTADDTSQMSYQWYAVEEVEGYNDYKKIEGAAADSYSAGPLTEDMQYACRVTDKYGNMRQCLFYIYMDREIASGKCGAQGDNLTWTLNSRGTLTISGTGDMVDINPQDGRTLWQGNDQMICNVVIQSGVTSIGDYAFILCENLESISIPQGVRRIGVGSICNNKLQELILLDGLTEIGEYALGGCTELTNVKLPDSLTTIGDEAFFSCISLESVAIPAAVTTIGDAAFEFCYSLKSVTLPACLTNIGKEVFVCCDSLQEIAVDSGNKQYCSVNGVLFDGAMKTLIAYPAGKREAVYRIPDGVVTIGDNAFGTATYLKEITIPGSVTDIGEFAFEDCAGIESVTIPTGVTSIGSGAFAGCDVLTSIDVSPGNKAFVSVDGVLFNASKKTLLQYPAGREGQYTVANGVTAIGQYAFYWCDKLTAVTVPDSVRFIGNRAFGLCDNLKSVSFQGAVPEFDGDVFYKITADIGYPANDNTWTADVRKDYGGTVTWQCYTPTTMVTVSAPASNKPLSAALIGTNGDTVAAGVIGDTLSLAEVPDGTYQMQVSQAGCVTRTVNVVVDSTSDKPVSVEEVTLVAVGDLNGVTGTNGEAEGVDDMQCLFEYLSQNEMNSTLVPSDETDPVRQAENEAYFIAVADVNTDGSVNILDYQALYEMVKRDYPENCVNLRSGVE